MDSSTVARRVMDTFPDAAVEAEGQDCNFTLTVISESFAGLLPVKRQQKVLSCFSEELASGELHALTVQSYTPTEWEARLSPALIQIE